MKLETRYSCPVCLGVKLAKKRLTHGATELLLDVCPRCGGIWFDAGEVEVLRRLPRVAAADLGTAPLKRADMRCHNCEATFDRNADECPACGRRNRIRCPACERDMRLHTERDLRIDICRTCDGVWVDHIELELIWQRALRMRPEGARRGARADATAQFFAESAASGLLYSPELLFLGARSRGVGVYDVGGVPESVPEIATSIGEGVADAAGRAFDAVLGAIGGLLEGIDF